MKISKAMVLAVQVASVIYIYMLFAATHPTAMLYMAYYLRMAQWHVANGLRFATAPAWKREAMIVRGRTPFK